MRSLCAQQSALQAMEFCDKQWRSFENTNAHKIICLQRPLYFSFFGGSLLHPYNQFLLFYLHFLACAKQTVQIVFSFAGSAPAFLSFLFRFLIFEVSILCALLHRAHCSLTNASQGARDIPIKSIFHQYFLDLEVFFDKGKPLNSRRAASNIFSL